MLPRIEAFSYSERFKRDLISSSEDTRAAVKAALALLLTNPSARSLRLHPLTGYGKPMIWKIDVFSNHCWQVTFELESGVAQLKRLGTHKQIDRNPR
jgi:mRNA-degrading endonuclease YafQ of YafQ-DinJ toxin-antitoxin module